MTIAGGIRGWRFRPARRFGWAPPSWGSWVCDLSAGGALLEGHCPAPSGQSLTASFHFSSFEIEIGAVIARNEHPRVPRFAVRFEAMSPDARDWLRTLVQQMRGEADVASDDASDLIVAESTDQPPLYGFAG